MDTRKSGSMTLDEIRDVLEKHYNVIYGGAVLKRKLLVTKSDGCYFLTLKGTPPKGFGIYIPERKKLCLYTPEGKRFKDYYLSNGIVDLN